MQADFISLILNKLSYYIYQGFFVSMNSSGLSTYKLMLSSTEIRKLGRRNSLCCVPRFHSGVLPITWNFMAVSPLIFYIIIPAILLTSPLPVFYNKDLNWTGPTKTEIIFDTTGKGKIRKHTQKCNSCIHTQLNNESCFAHF